MPNWCTNRLSVYGPIADLKKFAEGATDPDNTLKRYEQRKLNILSTYVPLPEGLDDWYDWCIANWSTKWGDCETVITYMGSDELTISFESAWSPPIVGLVKVSEKFPTLKFSFSFMEPGMGFVGGASMSAGRLLYNESGSLPMLDESASDVEQAWADYYEDSENLKFRFHLAATAALGPVSV